MARPLLIAAAVLFTLIASAADTRTTHGLSLFGDLKYPANFQHFAYVNPSAPKGGEARRSFLHGFDNLNPFIFKGRAAPGLALMYDTLLKSALDEPGSEYGLVAKTMEVPSDSSYVIFTIRPGARFHDGAPITADDVVFSFDTLRSKGAPFYRFYYANVRNAVALDKMRVKFTFDQAGNRELPLIMGQIAVLPKHYWQHRNFEKTTLERPIASGPYKIVALDPSQRVVYDRVKDYWGADLAVNRGQNNFDRITYVNFGDPEVELQGFFADVYDFRLENSAKNWATAYADKPAVKANQILRNEISLKNPDPMQGFVLNLRRRKFQDPRVRLALDYAFDFEWTNANLFYGQYARTTSYFQSSELAAEGLPGPLELELLTPFKDKLPAEVFTTAYTAPKTDGSGNDRENLSKAKALLEEAGWVVIDGNLTHQLTGEVMSMNFIDNDLAFEKVVAAYRQRLERLGIRTDYRLVDDAQYTNRLRTFDFDVVISGFAQSLSPGNEQRDFWGSEAAMRPESRNIAGIKDPVVDALIDKIIFAPDRAHLVAACRALDRVLLWNHYLVPQWHAPYERVAHWDRFGHPEPLPAYNLGFPDIWWFDAARAAATGKARN